MSRLVVVGMNFVTCVELVMTILENLETIITNLIANITPITFKLVKTDGISRGLNNRDTSVKYVVKTDERIHLDYGHITVKAPHPVRFEKLSTVELHQY